MTALSLPEEFTLLAGDRPRHPLELPYALCGAVLDELFLRQRLALQGLTVVVRDPVLTGEQALDYFLARIKGARPAGAAQWVASLAGMDNLRNLVVAGLARKGALDPARSQGVRERLRRSVLEGSLGSRDGLLLGLLDAAGRLGRIFTRDEQAWLSRALSPLAAVDPIAAAVRRAATGGLAPGGSWALNP